MPRSKRWGDLWPYLKCIECGRSFDLMDEGDATEWHYGHDCDPNAEKEE